MVSMQTVDFIRKRHYLDIILEKILPIEKERFPEMFVENTNSDMMDMEGRETKPEPAINNNIKSFDKIEFKSTLPDLDEKDLQWMDLYFNQVEFLESFSQKYLLVENYDNTYISVKHWFKALLTEGYWDPEYTDRILTNYYETKVMNYTLIKESSNYFNLSNTYEFYNMPKWFYNTLASIAKFKEEIVKEDGSIYFGESRLLNKIYYNLFDAALIILTRDFIFTESAVIYGLPLVNQISHPKESAYQNLVNFSNVSIEAFKSFDASDSEDFSFNDVLKHNKETYEKYEETFKKILDKFNTDNYAIIINDYNKSYTIKDFELLYATRVEFCKDCLTLVLMYEIMKKEREILNRYNAFNN